MIARQLSLGSVHQSLRQLFSLASLDWLNSLIHVGIHLGQLIPPPQVGQYEILDYDSVLELKNRTGTHSIFNKRQRVRFLQDNVIAFEDFAWGDGDIFASYRCAPGVVVDRYQEGDRWNVLISLRGSRQRGDIEEFNISRTVRDGFINASEWREIEVRHVTKRLRMSVIFPKSRQCRKAVLIQRSNRKRTVLNSNHFLALPDGRQEVRWQASSVPPLEVYTLKWWW